jgi:hypothetical protein
VIVGAVDGVAGGAAEAETAAAAAAFWRAISINSSSVGMSGMEIIPIGLGALLYIASGALLIIGSSALLNIGSGGLLKVVSVV